MSAYRAEATSSPLSVEEFERLPEEDAYRLELVRGRVVREPAPGNPHGRVAGTLAWMLGQYLHEHGGGVLYTDTGCLLSRDPATVRVPDLAVLLKDRAPPRRQRGFLHGAPDLAVEVLSPSNSASEMQDKVQQYLEAGARLVWLVDPELERIWVYAPGEALRVFGERDELDGGRVLPELRIPVEEIFTD